MSLDNLHEYLLFHFLISNSHNSKTECTFLTDWSCSSSRHINCRPTRAPGKHTISVREGIQRTLYMSSTAFRGSDMAEKTGIWSIFSQASQVKTFLSPPFAYFEFVSEMIEYGRELSKNKEGKNKWLSQKWIRHLAHHGVISGRKESMNRGTSQYLRWIKTSDCFYWEELAS